MKIESKSALIIIDQQKGITHPSLGMRNNEDAEKQMLWLLAEWRKYDWPVIHIKHRSIHSESVFWPLQEGFEIRPEFSPRTQEVIIEKQTPCAFSGTHLEDLLDDMNITQIVIVGASTSNSVEATVRSGACRGFSVIVVEDACFTFDKKDYFGTSRTAHEVHAMSLANLQGEYASIIHSSELVNR